MKMQKGFTLIELMIVVAIIGILAAIAIPQYTRYQAKAKFSAALAETSGLKVGMDDSLNSGTDVAKASGIGGVDSSANCSAIGATGTASTGIASITCKIQNAPVAVNTKTITWSRDASGAWTCASDITDKTLAPKSCGGA